ncbi:hypothetical protein PCC7424_0044 [Gloeothece citriformis PCC 7424]|uniref:Uncharacterized protein n=1 Tax=Gloeothece citriformis (strain PCC 7424) TaxID=65393 RepID=B7K829_GLOC7|nr:hypothetical protein [Gloeothece citriformis]ACK68517.1 hypothetical protein PCC7424_0044 [Gloeothece citriformis PCC 7424]
MRFQNSRIDLSEWVIHFVHDRNPNIEANLPIKIPVEFDENGQPVYSEEFQIEEYLNPHFKISIF